MASIITATTTSGLTQSADNSGVLQLASGVGNLITVPATTATMATVDGSGNASVTGNLSFNSGYGSSAVAYGCRAWVNFNGTGTVAIRASGNVSSITDDGTGTYTINFTTAMPDQNYACVGSAVNSSSFFTCITSPSNNQAPSIALRVTTDSGSLADPNFAYYAIFR